MTRRRFARLAALSTAAALAGCHGAVQRAATPSPFGRATFAVNWPAPSRLIPAASNSIVVQIKKGATVLQQKVLTRPSGGGATSVSFDQLPIGVLTAVATAYPTTSGTGVAQASATTSVTVQPGVDTPFRLTMASTIDRLRVAPSGTVTLNRGETLPLAASALDAAGNIVLTGPLQWSSTNTAIVSVDSAGKITAVGAGQASVTVREGESGKTLSVPVEVVVGGAPAVCYQLNPAHNGATTFGQPLTFPGAPAWSINLGERVNYPLVVDGRVFVLTEDATGGGFHLSALGLTQGATLWGPIHIPSRTSRGGFAYDSGKIMVATVEGRLFAFDATTGTPAWDITLADQREIWVPPTGHNGIVYVTSIKLLDTSAVVHAYDSNTGASLWSVSYDAGGSMVALAADSVFVSAPCHTFRYSPATGAKLWQIDGPCMGPSGRTPVISGSRLYVRDQVSFDVGVVLDATTGAATGQTFPDRYVPQVSDNIVVVLDRNGNLSATDMATGNTLWQATDPETLTVPPIAVDQYLFTATFSGTLQARNRTTGSILWSHTLNEATFFGEAVGTVETGIVAAEGYVLLPTGNKLTAWKFVDG